MWCSARIPPYAPRKEKTDPHLVHLSASPRRHPYGSPEGRFAWDEASKVLHRRLTQLEPGHASRGCLSRSIIGRFWACVPLHPQSTFQPVKASNEPYSRCMQLDAARRESLSERHADRPESDEREELPHDMATEVGTVQCDDTVIAAQRFDDDDGVAAISHRPSLQDQQPGPSPDCSCEFQAPALCGVASPECKQCGDVGTKRFVCHDPRCRTQTRRSCSERWSIRRPPLLQPWKRAPATRVAMRRRLRQDVQLPTTLRASRPMSMHSAGPSAVAAGGY